MGRNGSSSSSSSSSSSKVQQRKHRVHVECSNTDAAPESKPGQSQPKPGEVLRKPTVPVKRGVQYFMWVLLGLWCIASVLQYRRLMGKAKSYMSGRGTCNASCPARPLPSISSKDLLPDSTKAAVVVGRPPVSDARGQQLHQQPTLAPSLGTYPWPSFYSLPDDRYEPPALHELHADKRPNPYVVITYSGTFFGKTWEDQQRYCTVPCFISSNVDRWAARADIMVFHAPTLDVKKFMELEKPPGQLWALHSMESAAYYPFQGSQNHVMDRFDIQATPKLRPVDSQKFIVPAPYFSNSAYGDFKQKRPEMRNKTRLALWMHNNCEARSNREVLVQQLMRYMPVDSPGTCLHNYDPPGDAHKADPLSLLASYKFYIMFENAFGDNDWVSSTYFRTLDAGTVPVYLGAPNILKFAPGERSVIRACDFDSLEDLADYLQYLDRNDTAYMEYLSWKETGPSEEFQAMMQVSEPSTFCSMCIAAAALKLEAYDQQRQQMVLNHMAALRDFAALNRRLQKERSAPCKGRNRWWVVPFKDKDVNILDV